MLMLNSCDDYKDTKHDFSTSSVQTFASLLPSVGTCSVFD